ncbi:lipase, partial [Streptomyces kasugaensis]
MNTEHHWITTPITTDILRGALELEHTAHGVLPHRLPARARAQCSDGQLAMAESQPSGVRLVFRTRATAIELDTLRTKRAYVGVPPRPDGVYDLLVDGRLTGQATVTGGNTLTIDMTTGTAESRPGPPGTLRFTELPDGDKDVEIWLPYNETTELVALRTDAPVEPAPDRGRRVWLHHGSSISHGSDAASPTAIWPALAASLGGVELINLGLGGSALLDPFTARALRDTPADLISVKMGINLVNADLMRLRAFTPAVHGFLDTIR